MSRVVEDWCVLSTTTVEVERRTVLREIEPNDDEVWLKLVRGL